MNINDRDESHDPKTYMLNKKRTIILNTAVTEESAFDVSSQISYLNDRSGEDIILVINSPGGAVSDGLAIYDSMLASECDISTVATGMATSMGAFLLAAGSKGKRYATPNVKILLHQPLAAAQGQVSDIMILAENVQRSKSQLIAHLAAFTGQSPERVESDLDRDLWLSAEESLAYGIVDHIGYPE